MTERLHLAVSIVNYRTPALVVECVESVLPQIDPITDRIVVVDNQSGDDSVAVLRAAMAARHWHPVRLVEAPRNGGFSAGHNLGMESVASDWYLLLNSDTIVRPHAVERLLAAARAAPDVGILSPRLEWPDGRPQTSCFRFHTPISELIHAAATGPITRFLERWNVPMPIPDTAVEVPWTSFAAVLLRGAMRDEVGPMDEGFFMYYEDVDYCRRARRAVGRSHEPSARSCTCAARARP